MFNRKSRLNKFVLFLLLAGIGLALIFGLISSVLNHSDFQISYTGSVSGEFRGQGMFPPCVQTNGSPWYPEIWLQDDDMKNWIVLKLPIGGSSGRHPFSNNGNLGETYFINGTISSSETVYYSLEHGELVSGYIVIDSIPHAPGQKIKGYFEASFYDQGTQATVNLKGRFSFDGSSDSSYDCLD